ncbi:MAG: TonB-dependent siderophore receptor [Opitutaceae bacterium]|nr:TonB-dependent siderophore receptor [Opitutaceae bacterium]
MTTTQLESLSRASEPSPLAAASRKLPLPSAAATIAAMLFAHGTGVTAAEEASDSDDAAEPTRLDQVVVEGTSTKYLSSPKFSEPLRDTPQTVVVVPQVVIEQQGAINLSDVLRNTPGITFLAGEGGGASSTAGDAFFMRGFDASNNIFVDGVRDSGAAYRDVFNLEQVEIAKGSAGADSGRGATSGYINLASKSPRMDEFKRAQVSYGSGELRRVTTDINTPLSDRFAEGAAFRLNLLYQEAGVAGRDWAEQNRWGLAPSLALGLGTGTSVDVGYQFVEQDNLPDYGLPTAAFPGLKHATPAQGVSQRNFYGLKADFEDVEQESATLRVSHAINERVKLSNQSRWAKTSRLAEITVVTSPTAYNPATQEVARARQRNDRDTSIVSNQTLLTAEAMTGSVSHAISAGVDLTREKALSTSWTGLGSVATTSIHKPDSDMPVVGYAPAPSGAATDGRIDTAGLFVFDTAKFSPALQVIGGLRVEHYGIDYASTPATGSTTTPMRVERDEDVVTWKAGVVYKPVQNGSIYAAIGTSSRPPGTNLTFSANATNADNPLLDPQETTNRELGVKWDVGGGRLSLTAALFQSENSNVPTTDSASGLVVQAVDQKVEGVEFGVSGQVTDKWLVFGGLAFMDSEYTAPSSTAAGATNGAELQWTPDVSGNLWSTYRLPFGLTVGGGARYMSTVARQTTQSPSTTAPEMPSYWVFDTMLEYDVSPNLGVRLNVSNVGDEVYSRSLNNNGGRYLPGAPRTFMITASFKF